MNCNLSLRLRLLVPVLWLGLAVLGSGLACVLDSTAPVIYVTATAVPTMTAVLRTESTLPNPFLPTPTPSGPTATPLQPTPNPTFPPVVINTKYAVQNGDTLALIAQTFGTDVQTILALNPGMTAVTVIYPGQTITVPGRPSRSTPAFKIIPDSELVNSPAAIGFDIAAYIKFQPGFIRVYSEEMQGQLLNGADIVRFVSTSTSVNPRLLLALLEFRGGWISSPVPGQDSMTYPMGFRDPNTAGLFRQLSWAANQLNAGYYGWKTRGLTAVQFAVENTRLAYAPELNAGTVGVQYLLARTATDRARWDVEVSPAGFFTTYMSMFGDPFRYAVEPLVPPNLTQPSLSFPFNKGEIWFFTGGPHGGWDSSGSGWAAIDFAPPTPSDYVLIQGGACYISPYFATAVADGLIVRSGDGAVVLDLDKDGDERTGWTILYLHMAEQDRVKAGTQVQTGARIGHPSCEGFFLNASATHLHIARRYNGEWIAADCWACPPGIAAPPFVMGGWVIKGYPNQIYQGWMEKAGQVRRAEQGRDDPANQVSW